MVGRLAGILLALFAVACRAPMRARPVAKAAAPDDTVAVRDVLTPDRVPLPMTCTPTGPELCFDATDNNCNGIIDEGCGIETGPLQFVIAWPEGADADLVVTDPNGDNPEPENHTPSGLTKGRDCGRAQSICHGQNFENVYFAGDRPPPGRYVVAIKVAGPDDVHFPVTVRFGGRIGIKTFSLDVSIDAVDTPKVFELTIQ